MRAETMPCSVCICVCVCVYVCMFAFVFVCAPRLFAASVFLFVARQLAQHDARAACNAKGAAAARLERVAWLHR